MKTVLFRVSDILGTLGMRGAAYVAGNPRVTDLQNLRRIDYVEFLLVVTGEGWWTITSSTGEATRIPMSPGLVAFVRPTDETSFEGAGPDGVELLVVSLPIPTWAAFADFIGIDPALKAHPGPVTALVDVDHPRARGPFELALHRFYEGPTLLDLAEFLTAVIPLVIPDRSRETAAARAPVWLTRSLQAMRDEGNLRRGVSRFAELAHVSPQHLARTTREFFAATPTELVAELRLRHASVLLTTTSETVGSIGRRCGYATLSHFSASFQRAYGRSPREHRSTSV